MKRSRTLDKTVKLDASELEPPTPDDMARLKGAMDGPIDTSKMPEITDEALRSGRLVLVRSPKLKNRKSTRPGKVA